MDKDEKKDQIVWHEINVHMLAGKLAEGDWEKQAGGVDESCLYTTHVVSDLQGNVEVKKEVSEEWASLFWCQYENYKQLIMSFSKTYNEDDKGELQERDTEVQRSDTGSENDQQVGTDS